MANPNSRSARRNAARNAAVVAPVNNAALLAELPFSAADMEDNSVISLFEKFQMAVEFLASDKLVAIGIKSTIKQYLSIDLDTLGRDITAGLNNNAGLFANLRDVAIEAPQYLNTFKTMVNTFMAGLPQQLKQQEAVQAFQASVNSLTFEQFQRDMRKLKQYAETLRSQNDAAAAQTTAAGFLNQMQAPVNNLSGIARTFANLGRTVSRVADKVGNILSALKNVFSLVWNAIKELGKLFGLVKKETLIAEPVAAVAADAAPVEAGVAHEAAQLQVEMAAQTGFLPAVLALAQGVKNVVENVDRVLSAGPARPVSPRRRVPAAG